MEVIQGSLTMTGLNTDSAQVFWNGHPVTGIVEIKVDWEEDDNRIKLKVNGTDDALYMKLIEGGIIVKRVSNHE